MTIMEKLDAIQNSRITDTFTGRFGGYFSILSNTLVYINNDTGLKYILPDNSRRLLAMIEWSIKKGHNLLVGLPLYPTAVLSHHHLHGAWK